MLLEFYWSFFISHLFHSYQHSPSSLSSFLQGESVSPIYSLRFLTSSMDKIGLPKGYCWIPFKIFHLLGDTTCIFLMIGKSKVVHALDPCYSFHPIVSFILYFILFVFYLFLSLIEACKTHLGLSHILSITQYWALSIASKDFT